MTASLNHGEVPICVPKRITAPIWVSLPFTITFEIGHDPPNNRPHPRIEKTAVPEKSTNEEIEQLNRRRAELKKQSEEIEGRLEKLQNELKKVTGRIVLPEDARRSREGNV